jgi:hypothetical protein
MPEKKQVKEGPAFGEFHALLRAEKIPRRRAPVHTGPPKLRVIHTPSPTRTDPIEKALREELKGLPEPKVGEFVENPAADQLYGTILSRALNRVEEEKTKPKKK